MVNQAHLSNPWQCIKALLKRNGELEREIEQLKKENKSLAIECFRAETANLQKS